MTRLPIASCLLCPKPQISELFGKQACQPSCRCVATISNGIQGLTQTSTSTASSTASSISNIYFSIGVSTHTSSANLPRLILDVTPNGWRKAGLRLCQQKGSDEKPTTVWVAHTTASQTRSQSRSVS